MKSSPIPARLALACAAALSTASALAQEAAIVGRVLDENIHAALAGAKVRVVGTQIQSYTDEQGHFAIPNAPAGEQTIEFSYLGYATYQKTVDIPAEGAIRVEAQLTDGFVYELDNVSVRSSLVGSARAQNQQRAAESLSNIVAADAIGNFPDQNAAESLQRLPGVALYRDQGEGRYIVLRGLNYNFTSVELDGSSFAGADLGERATALDVVSSDLLSSIEVTKVPTPDLDAEGIAGKVNIKTKSPFDGDTYAASLRYQTQYSNLADTFSHKFNGEMTWIAPDGKWGFLVAPSWQNRTFGSHNFEVADAWSLEENPIDGTEHYFPEEVQYREYEIERTRKGITGSVEYRPGDNARLYLNLNYNHFNDTENRWRVVIPFSEGEIESLDADSGEVSGMRRISRRLRQREKDQEVYGAVAGFEKRVGNWSFDGSFGFSKGTEKRPNEMETNFRRSVRDGGFRYDFSDPYNFNVEQIAGAALDDPASYNQLNAVEVANESGDETSYDLAANARLDFGAENPSYLKFGARYRSREKTSAVEVVEYSDGPDDFTFANLVQSASDYPFSNVPRISASALRAYFEANRSAFEAERLIEDSALNDWSTDEDIFAAYGMYGLTIGRSHFLAGARFEATDFASSGNELIDEGTIQPGRSAHDYDNVLPSVHYRYDVTDDLVLRASWSNGLARPDFGNTAFRKSINNEDGEITVGNPELETLESSNWDASVEYYLPNLGLLSAAVFYKDLSNFAYEIELDGIDPAYPDYAVTTFRNGSEGSIQGLELAYQQQLQFGFGIDANITFLDSEANYPTRPGEKLPFIGQSDRVANFALTYDKGRWFARAAVNYRSERLREDEAFGGDPYSDLWVDDFTQLDLTFRYQLDERWTLYSELLNVTDEPFRVFLKSPDGAPDRLGQFEEYGWNANLGVRWRY